MKLTKKTWPIFVLVGVLMTGAMYAAYLAVFIFVIMKAPAIDEIDFDSAKWKSTDPDWTHDSIRLRMIDDLMGHHQLVWKSREEIVELLGDPDDVDYFAEYEMVWWLGPERGFMAIDSEWLLIDLDENDIAIEVRLGTD